MNSIEKDPTAAALEVVGLHHTFSGRRVLNDVGFVVAPGSIHGFVGPNGAGKTTTLKIAATLLEPWKGTVRIYGLDTKKRRSAVRFQIGYLPDTDGLYRRMTVQEYLEFFAAAYGFKAAQRSKVVDDVLQITDLGSRRHDLIRGLSRGMEQRLGLARVLVHDPGLLLLDEPASGLDPRARIELMEILRELRTMGKTVFISSHILSELAPLCDAVTIIDRGEVRYTGSMETLLTHDTEEESVFEFVLEEEHESLCRSFQAQEGVRRVDYEAESRRLTLWVVRDCVAAEDLLRRALDAGARIRSFDRSKRHLDRAFLELTQPGVGP